MKARDGYQFDGDRFHVLAEDGSIAASFPLAEIECEICGRIFRNADRWARGVLVTSARVFAGQEHAFCSAGCREAWWVGRGDDLFAPVDTPATIETYLCDICQPVGTYDRLVGVGEIHTRIEGGELVIASREEFEIDRMPIVVAPDCKMCVGKAVVRKAPIFYFGRRGDFGWRAQWSEEQFDRDLLVSIYDLDEGAFQLWETRGELHHLRMDRVIGQIRFATPHDINRWWQERGLHAIASPEFSRARTAATT